MRTTPSRQLAAFVFLSLTVAVAACRQSHPPDAPTTPVPSGVREDAMNDQEIAPLVVELKSADPAAVGRAADALSAKISPWQRAIQTAQHKSQVRLFTPPRPTGRPSLNTLNASTSKKIEAAAITALKSLDVNVKSSAGVAAREHVAALLAEVADVNRDSDGDARTYLRNELAGTNTADAALPIMRALETIYGLPAFFEPYPLNCGEPGPPDVTASIQKQHDAEQAKRFKAGRLGLLAWVDAHAKEPRDSQILAALKAWDDHQWIAQPNTAPKHIDFSTVLRYETIIRLGEDALTPLRARRDAAIAADNEEDAGRYETFITAISGVEDQALVKRLLSSSEHRPMMFGVEIIGALGDTPAGRRYTRDLDKLQHIQMSEVAHLASKALASILGREAIPLLKKAAAENTDNFTAKYAAEELSEKE